MVYSNCFSGCMQICLSLRRQLNPKLGPISLNIELLEESFKFLDEED